jgi:hypothetical protein
MLKHFLSNFEIFDLTIFYIHQTFDILISLSFTSIKILIFSFPFMESTIDTMLVSNYLTIVVLTLLRVLSFLSWIFNLLTTTYNFLTLTVD